MITIRTVTTPTTSPSAGTCYFFGGSHYRTFDGSLISFTRPGCRHTLVSEPLTDSLRVESQARIVKLTRMAKTTTAPQTLPTGGLVVYLSLDTDHYRLEVVNGRPVVTLAGASLAVPGRCFAPLHLS